jgi:hypothetical protein
MGFFKKIKKAVSSVTKSISKATGLPDPVGDALNKDEEKPAAVAQAPQQQAAPAPVVTQVTNETAKKDSEGTDEGDTEAAKKAAAARGKRSLSVARSSGTGLNL